MGLLLRVLWSRTNGLSMGCRVLQSLVLCDQDILNKFGSLVSAEVDLLHVCSPGLIDKFMAVNILFARKVVHQSVLKMPPLLLPSVLGRERSR